MGTRLTQLLVFVYGSLLADFEAFGALGLEFFLWCRHGEVW
jgi:hypothetical protein